MRKMKKIFFHDAKFTAKRCQISTDDLELVLDLGHQPLCDSLNEDQLNRPEKLTIKAISK